MDFPTAIKTCLGKYVEFQGRARRSEYWYFYLFQVLLYFVAFILDSAFGSEVLVSLLVTLGLLLPSLAVQVRRLHDIDRSGWWMFLALIPIVGAILLIVWCCKRGDATPNRFGPAPVGAEQGAEVASSTHSKRPNDVDALERLFALHEKGVLTKEEFEAQKAVILR